VNSTAQIRKKRRRPSRAVRRPWRRRQHDGIGREIYEVTTHETSSSPAESVALDVGSATLVTLASRIRSTDTSITVTVIAQRRVLPSGSSPAARPSGAIAGGAAGRQRYWP
jgi:hypothetical protein